MVDHLGIRVLTLPTLLALAGALLLAPGPAHAGVPTCHGHKATIVGTPGRDHLYGTRGRDVIVGGRGQDHIYGRGGRDLICGGKGQDHLYGGRGDDHLRGGPDRLRTRNGVLRHRGDSLAGGPGDDVLVPGVDRRVPDGIDEDYDTPDTVSWRDSKHAVEVDARRGTATGEGHDRVRGLVGAWLLSAHDDRFTGTGGPDTVYGFFGDDRIRTRAGDDVVEPGPWWFKDGRGPSDDDRVRTGPGDDSVQHSPGADDVATGSGDDDVTDWGPCADGRVVLGVGDDHLLLESSTSDDATCPEPGAGLLTALAGPGAETDQDTIELTVSDATSTRWDMATGELVRDGQVVAWLTGFDHATLIATGQVEVSGTDGDDTLAIGRRYQHSPTVRFLGLAGNDVFSGGDEDDRFEGGDGDDTYLADSGGTNTCDSVEHDPDGACAGP